MSEYNSPVPATGSTRPTTLPGSTGSSCTASSAWTQYVERTSALTPDDWRQVAADTEALNADLAAAHRAGVVPGSDEASALAERHRESFSRYFDCTHAMHACLARTFISEPGYASYFESLSPGLTRWLHALIFANTSAHGVDPESATWS